MFLPEWSFINDFTQFKGFLTFSFLQLLVLKLHKIFYPLPWSLEVIYECFLSCLNCKLRKCFLELDCAVEIAAGKQLSELCSQLSIDFSQTSSDLGVIIYYQVRKMFQNNMKTDFKKNYTVKKSCDHRLRHCNLTCGAKDFGQGVVIKAYSE